MAVGFSDLIVVNSLSGTVTQVIARPVTLTAVRAINTTAADAYVQLFDVAVITDVTLGTTLPAWVVLSDPSDLSLGDGLPNGGLSFHNGIAAASTTTTTGLTGAAQHVRLAVM